MKTALNEGLSRAERVLRRADFLNAQAAGKRLHGKIFVMLLRTRADLAPARLGVTVSRKVGNSVVRHLIKRWIREVFRCNKALFQLGDDCVVIVREGAVVESLEQVKDEIVSLVSQRHRAKAPPQRWENNRRKPNSKPSPEEKKNNNASASGSTPGQKAPTDAKHSGPRSNE